MRITAPLAPGSSNHRRRLSKCERSGSSSTSRWTQAGVSRSAFAARFNRLLGEEPLAYVARWRIQLGARLLEATDDSVLQIALKVGCESEAAFNRAFKREFGLPPARYRRRRSEELASDRQLA
jgi:AraC-like DNA-binding protein